MFSNFHTTLPIIIFLALLLDLSIGWPRSVFLAIGHPVTWIGNTITILEINLNRPHYSKLKKRFMGFLLLFTMTIPTLIIILFFLNMVTNFWLYVVVNIVLISPLLAARSLYTHVNDIYKKLNEDDLTNSRAALAKIVGRDVKNLSEKNICKAAIESLAESTADGVIAPLFWAVIFGFPGILMYKIVNTLDSMVGYKNVRFSDFGWASAKLDDIINWIPARLTAILFSFLTLKPIETLSFSWRNSTVSPSPNAGWPQAAMAFALNISLMGSKTYGELVVKQITINETFPSPTRQNLFEALKFYKNTVVLSLAILLMVYFLESVIA